MIIDKDNPLHITIVTYEVPFIPEEEFGHDPLLEFTESMVIRRQEDEVTNMMALQSKGQECQAFNKRQVIVAKTSLQSKTIENRKTIKIKRIIKNKSKHGKETKVFDSGKNHRKG